MCAIQKIRGVTVIELIFTLSIFGLVTAALATMFISGLRHSDTLFDQLSAQSDGKKVVETFVRDARKAESSSIGSYAIESAAENELIFFANVDADTLRERVRYTLSGNTVKRGITKPSGEPLRYVTSTETVAEIAHDVQNAAAAVPFFTYYGSAYTGSEAPLSSPPTTTAVNAIKVQIELERDPNASPVPFHVESFVRIRNMSDPDK